MHDKTAMRQKGLDNKAHSETVCTRPHYKQLKGQAHELTMRPLHLLIIDLE